MILQVLNLSKVSTVFCSPQCKSQPSSLGSRPGGTVLNLVGTNNFKVINYIKRGQNYYVVTIYYFLQNWYQLNNKNSKLSAKDGGDKFLLSPYVPPGLQLSIHRVFQLMVPTQVCQVMPYCPSCYHSIIAQRNWISLWTNKLIIQAAEARKRN